jgi:hypothetical protein
MYIWVMKPIFTLLFLFLLSDIQAQNGGLLDIKKTRRALMEAFQREDALETGLLMDSLIRMENIEQAALVWDERWLLYLWMGAYGNLFAEAAEMNADKKAEVALKNQPLPDSLYTVLDAGMFENRFVLYKSLQTSLLSNEEQAFTALLFDYLLRLNENITDWNERLGVFESKFPESRFLPFIHTLKKPVLKRNPRKGSFGILAGQVQPDGEAQRYLSSGFCLSVDLAVWQNRWNILLSCNLSALSLRRDLYNLTDTWPKGSPATLNTFTLGLGYDLWNSNRLRITPAGGIGFSTFGPTDSEDDPAPEEYLYFKTFSWHLHQSLNIDLKRPFSRKKQSFDKDDDYFGLRFRIGYEWLHFGNTISELKGNQFFIGVGVCGFGD